MRAEYEVLSPRGKAQSDYRHGSGHDANPYQKGTAEHDAYMIEMGRLQAAELRGLIQEMRGAI